MLGSCAPPSPRPSAGRVMKILAVDTATERCSVALLIDGRIIERCRIRRAATRIWSCRWCGSPAGGGVELRTWTVLLMVEGPARSRACRIAVGVAQGLAFGAQAADRRHFRSGCRRSAGRASRESGSWCAWTHAWARFTGRVFDAHVGRRDLVVPSATERVDPPAGGRSLRGVPLSGRHRVSRLSPARPSAAAAPFTTLLPRAREIALLGRARVRAGRGIPPRRRSRCICATRSLYVKKRS